MDKSSSESVLFPTTVKDLTNQYFFRELVAHVRCKGLNLTPWEHTKQKHTNTTSELQAHESVIFYIHDLSIAALFDMEKHQLLDGWETQQVAPTGSPSIP